VKVLVEALTFPRERRARSEAAQALVRRGYCWQAVASRVAEVYEQVRS
jgi:hypothetical protein